MAPTDRPALGLVGGAGALPALMAREAQEVARGLVAGTPAANAVAYLLESWAPLAAVAA